MRICSLTRLTLAHGAKGGLEVHVKTLSEGVRWSVEALVNRELAKRVAKAARRKAELALSSERMIRDALRLFESDTNVGD